MNAQRIARLVVWFFLLLPVTAGAQAVNATIAGVVRDASGGVMPGVTVEATSPALIEKARSVVTDGQGLYRIVDLRPGTYIVVFTLPGFNTFRREGLELTTGFTANVNAELRVGALEESITVTGEAPVVDIQNIREQTTIRRDMLDALPTTRRLAQLATLIPAATTGGATFVDVGGVGSDRGQIATHGQRPNDMSWNVGGIDSRVFTGGNFMFNVHTFQELVVETLAGSAETSTGGVQLNVVPKDGGNRFSGTFSTEHTGPGLQNDNIDDKLRARGLTVGPASSSVRKYYDTGGGFGGPIRQNKLWFFAAHRWLVKSQYQQGNYWNKRQGTLFYEPDLDRPAYIEDTYKDTSVRLTWQAAAKHKITFSHSQQPACQCFFGLLESATGGGALLTPEATAATYYNPGYMPMATWTFPATNRLLIEASGSANGYFRNPKRQPGVDGDDIAVTDVGKNLSYGSRATAITTGYNALVRMIVHQRAAVSYVTGSHTFKAGFDANQYSDGRKKYEDPNSINQARSYRFQNEVPVSVTIWATPFGTYNTARDFAIYLQDQWTIRRATLNLGVRYSDYKATVPTYHLDAGLWVPARDFPAVDNVPHWQDLNVRLGVAYDLLGNGKTALKMTLGRYPPRSDPAAVNIPATNAAPSATRTWNDYTYPVGDPRRGNYIPDCVLGPSLPGANGECGAVSDANFGRPRVSSTRRADDALTGFNRQGYNWQSSVSLQHELRPNIGLSVGYFRTWYGAFLATDNRFVTAADYDPFCITAPADSRLPSNVGGQQICGLYDVKPTVFGQVDNLVTQASHYGEQSQVYSGFDVTLNARLGQGVQFSGGLSTGQTVYDTCDFNNLPQVQPLLVQGVAPSTTFVTPRLPEFCHIATPWNGTTQVKFAVVYPLPWDLQTSAIYQNLPGSPLRATYVATNAQILPSLGRNLGSCRGAATCNGTVSIDLFPPNTIYEDRIQQIDIRVSRLFRMGRAGVRGNFDVYNLFNANTVLNLNTGYGSQWLQPIQIMGGRLFKFGAQINF